MTGTIYGLPLSQRVDINGRPLSGALLYLYAANTSTPVNSYQDFGLTLLNTNPLEADASGMIPEFWLADGSYRARLTTAVGQELFDLDNVQALGPSTGTGGGSGATIDPTTIAQTGDTLWVAVAGTRTGWVRLNGRTIGNASSGATERANADTEDLFIYLWTNFANAICPVSGGRTGTALGDYTANKNIGTFDMRGVSTYGLDDMGNSAAGIIVGGTTPGEIIPGAFGGFSSGNWTPALAFGGSATGITYATQIGKYVRIGNEVTVWGEILLTNSGSATGEATITGLPYVSETIAGMVFSGVVGNAGNIIESGAGLAISLESAASSIDILICEGDTQDDYLTAVQDDNLAFTNTAELSFSLTYRTDVADAATFGSRLGTYYIKL